MTDAVSDRAFLSIGEVLELLKSEFPDITISKIRFLESQGLIDPDQRDRRRVARRADRPGRRCRKFLRNRDCKSAC